MDVLKHLLQLHMDLVGIFLNTGLTYTPLSVSSTVNKIDIFHEV